MEIRFKFPELTDPAKFGFEDGRLEGFQRMQDGLASILIHQDLASS